MSTAADLTASDSERNSDATDETTAADRQDARTLAERYGDEPIPSAGWRAVYAAMGVQE